MPTKKKRVGFIPREEVMKIINRLSIENNLSNSKIISILVEEALSIRGIFDRNNGKLTNNIKHNNKHSQDYSDFNDNDIFIINTKLRNENHPEKTNLLKQKDQKSYDLHTYKKFLSFLKFQEMLDEYNN